MTALNDFKNKKDKFMVKLDIGERLCWLIVFLAIISLFGFYIKKSYEQQPISMSAIQDGENNTMEQLNGKAIN